MSLELSDRGAAWALAELDRHVDNISEEIGEEPILWIAPALAGRLWNVAAVLRDLGPANPEDLRRERATEILLGSRRQAADSRTSVDLKADVAVFRWKGMNSLTLYVPPADLDDAQGEVYRALRADHMSIDDAHQAARAVLADTEVSA